MLGSAKETKILLLYREGFVVQVMANDGESMQVFMRTSIILFLVTEQEIK